MADATTTTLLEKAVIPVVTALIAATAVYVGHRINKSTAVNTAQIDDRDKFTQKLIGQLERAETKIQ